MTPLELHKTALYKNQGALDLLDQGSELSREQLQQCFDNGSVWLESSTRPKRLRDSAAIIQPGQQLHLYCNDFTLTPCPFTPELIQDFGAFSIWNKPSGMLSQGSKWGDHWALYRWVEQQFWPDRQCFISHRLDRYTSGLIIVAHESKINKAFHQLFAERAIHKTYRAIVRGAMQPGESRTLDEAIDGKPALSQIIVLESDREKDLSLLEIHPESGRKHQIRIHLAGIDHPVLNDRNYGAPPHHGDLMLQACALEFTSPVSQQDIRIQLDEAQLLCLAPHAMDKPIDSI